LKPKFAEPSTPFNKVVMDIHQIKTCTSCDQITGPGYADLPRSRHAFALVAASIIAECRSFEDTRTGNFTRNWMRRRKTFADDTRGSQLAAAS